jgi:hypothetical protein
MRKDLFLRGNPGLKSETWATHSFLETHLFLEVTHSFSEVAYHFSRLLTYF